MTDLRQPELVRGYIRHDQDADPLFGSSPAEDPDLPLLVFESVQALTVAELLRLAGLADPNRPVITYREHQPDVTQALPVLRRPNAADHPLPPDPSSGDSGSDLVGGEHPVEGDGAVGGGHPAVVVGRASVDGHEGFDQGFAALKGRR